MVDGGDDVELELAVGRGLKYTSIDFDFLDTWAKELLQRSNNTGFLASAGGAIDEKVREVATLRLTRQSR